MKEATLPASTPSVHRLDAPSLDQLEQLAQVLVDCVQGGASVSFMLPLSLDHALAFWQGVAEGVAGGDRVLLVAEDQARNLGETLLVLDTASADAERLYNRLGWVRCGQIPGFALLPAGGLRAITLYCRALG